MFKHDGNLNQALLRAGYSVRDMATHLGVTEKFLRQKWHDLKINPEFDHERVCIPDTECATRREAWLDALREGIEEEHPRHGHVVRRVTSVGDAAKVWGVLYQTARKRLLKLGWKPYTAVHDIL